MATDVVIGEPSAAQRGTATVSGMAENLGTALTGEAAASHEVAMVVDVADSTGAWCNSVDDAGILPQATNAAEHEAENRPPDVEVGTPVPIAASPASASVDCGDTTKIERPRREKRLSFKATSDEIPLEAPIEKRSNGGEGAGGAKKRGKKRPARREGAGERKGPCAHCGVMESPQWRKGPPKKPILCNACGTRYMRTKSLGHSDRYKAQRARAEAKAKAQDLAEAAAPRERKRRKITNRRKRINATTMAITSASVDGFTSGTDPDPGRVNEMASDTDDVLLELEEEKPIDMYAVADTLLLAVTLALEREEGWTSPVCGEGNEDEADVPTGEKGECTETAVERADGKEEDNDGADHGIGGQANIVPIRLLAMKPPTPESLEQERKASILQYTNENPRAARFLQSRKSPPGDRYIGVTCAVNRKGKTWQARIRGPGPDGRERAYVHLGMHNSPEAAARAFDRAAILVHGLRRAVLNFPVEDYADEFEKLRRMSLAELAAEYRCRPHASSQPHGKKSTGASSPVRPGAGHGGWSEVDSAKRELGNASDAMRHGQRQQSIHGGERRPDATTTPNFQNLMHLMTDARRQRLVAAECASPFVVAPSSSETIGPSNQQLEMQMRIMQLQYSAMQYNAMLNKMGQGSGGGAGSLPRGLDAGFVHRQA